MPSETIKFDLREDEVAVPSPTPEPESPSDMEFTGERYVPHLDTPEISYEHWHRYFYASQFAAGKVTLDVASGEGYGSSLLAQFAARVVGVDRSAEAVSHARRKYPLANLEFVESSACAIALPRKNQFDLAVSFETIEHLHETEQKQFLSEIKRLLKPQGQFLVSTPNKISYSDSRDYKNPYHLREFELGEFETFLKGYFRYVSLLGQRTYPASYLWPLSGPSGMVSEFELEYRGGAFHPAAPSGKEVLYIIAVCSDQPLLEVNGSVQFDLSEQATYQRMAHLAERGRTIQQLSNRLAQSETAHRTVQTQHELRLTEVNELKHALRAKEADHRQIDELRSQVQSLIRDVQTSLDRFETRNREFLEAGLRTIRDEIAHRDEATHSTLDELWAASFCQWDGAEPLPAKADYRRVVRKIHGLLRARFPSDTIAAIVSRGDPQLVRNTANSPAWHFPQTETGVYAGSYPSCSHSAIAHLESLRVRGADAFVIPATSLWWLTHYPQFASYLRRFEDVADDETLGAIFDLRQLKSQDPATPLVAADPELALVEYLQSETDAPAVLDWNSGLNFNTIAGRCAVFSPPEAGDTLPYLDKSVEIVAIPSRPSLQREAERVATVAVVTAPTPPGTSFQIQWLTAVANRNALSASIIVPQCQDFLDENRYWHAFVENLPKEFVGEIVTDSDVTSIVNALAGRTSRPLPKFRQLERRPQERSAVYFNRAVEDSTCDTLVFLMPAVLPLNGWLNPLLETLADARSAIVGGKVFAPDGRLESAGSTLFADGRLCDFGTGDAHVEDPLYEYVRNGNCSSRQALAINRSLFQVFGRFDAKYDTVPYLFADLSLRARRQGKRVCYQPASRFVVTQRSATQETGELQDRAAFRTRWAVELETMPRPRTIFDRYTWYSLAAH